MKTLAFALLIGGCAAAAQAAPARHATLPSVSPDGQRIVFLADRDGDTSQVWVIRADGRGLKRVTQTPGRKGAARWSRDGTRILYSSSQGDTLSLWSIPLAGGDPVRIGALPAKTAALSNDGRRVAYTSGSWTRNRVVVARMEGSHATAVTDSSVGFFNVAWSPNDSLLAVTRRDTTNELQIWLVDADGRDARHLTRFGADERPQGPAWSPDGKKIALQAGRSDRSDPTRSRVHIWIVDVATGKTTELAPQSVGHLDETPSWFPDGKRIAFQSDRSGAFEIWVMNIDGSGLRQITR